MAKLSKSREKYLADKLFGAKNTKNIPPQLSEFGCRDCEISDEDLFFISQYVTDIGKLILGSTDVTETGLQYLKKIKTVEYLDLRSLPLNEDNSDCILHLKSLKYLYIKFTGITVNGISAILKSLPELQTLVATIPQHEEHFIELWQRQYPTVELVINVD